MPKKALASLNVVLNAVTSPLFRGLALASKRLIAFGAKMKAIGRSISMSFTLPFAMIGAAGAKMAIDFEKNMTKVNTLVGISKKEVNAFAKDVMKLSTDTAQAPADLADGLFFLTSAGLRASNAMETLEAVAKGTAIGLGEQTDLAKVSAAAQNAYGKETITASKALDVFGVAVQQGMFEASDLAAVLGTQLGMASSLGISFEETNAFIATYTKTTGDANAASTSFGGVMMALAKITPKQGRALTKISMNADTLQTMLGEQGLRATLMHLKKSFEEQGVPLSKFFSKSQALKGVLGVLGNQTETYGEVLEAMGDSAGFVDEGFETLSETAGFRLNKAFNNLKNTAMELGTRLMPIFESIIGFFTKIAGAFTKLDEGKKKLLLGAMALVAFSGPLMTLGGGLLSVLGALLSPIGLVVLALGGLFYVITKNWDYVKRIFVNFVNYFIDLYNESIIFRGAVQLVILVFKNLWAQAKFTFGAMKGIVSNLITTWISQFKAVAKVIAAALKLDPKGIKEGAKDYMKAAADGIKGSAEVVKEQAKILGDDIAKNVADAISNTMSREKIEFITEDQVQASMDSLKDLLGDKFQQAKDYLSGLIGGGMLTMNEEEEEEEEKKGDDGTKNLQTSLGKKKSLLQQYLDWAKGGYEGLVGKISEAWAKIAEVAGQALGAISGMWDAQHEKAMTIMNNEKTEAQENMTAEYDREVMKIENSVSNKEKQEEMLTALKEKYDAKKHGIDEKFSKKEKELKAKKAKRDKQMKIADAIMGTANAIVTALGAGPIVGPILAAFVGALGAVQIATIASTPIPMAKGGLAFGPTNAIVGDNPGAAHDPEVIAPLSKLRQMMGMNVELNVAGVVKGSDIWLSNDDTSIQRPRYI